MTNLYDVTRAEFSALVNDLSALNAPNNSIFELVPKDQHLLIAGATGAGKSVFLNGLICELLKTSPFETWLILIDPKKTELTDYKDLPHTMTYASDSETIVNVFNFACNLMGKRFQRMQKRGLKNYDGAHVYIIIDELAPLMLNDKKRIEPLLNDLMLLGRAARVHIIACTQRATASVIGSVLKANIVHRIALRTSTKQESRNILEVAGAEKLPRHGTCVYSDGIDYTRHDVPMVDALTVQSLIDGWEDWERDRKKNPLTRLKRLLNI